MSTTSIGAHGRHVLHRIVFSILLGFIGVFFALPLTWLFIAPFDENPTMALKMPEWSLANFHRLADNPYAFASIVNSLIIAGGTMLLTVVGGTLASYALSRVRIPMRDGLLYGMLLLSSIVTGTAAMVPTFQLMNAIGLIDTHTGVILVLTGGMLPTVIFILKDFMDSVPKSYEESARLAGAGPARILWDVVIPIARPGIAFVAIWTVVQGWGNFLVPFILLRDPSKQPAAVVMYTFYTEAGQVDLRLLSVFALVFALPVLLIYFFVNRRFGFRFYGGIKS